MTTRIPRIIMVLLAVSALSACSSAVSGDAPEASSPGVIEVAVSEVCASGGDKVCASVNGEEIVVPASYEQVGVLEAAAADRGVVNLTLDPDGASVLHALTEEAAQSGGTARLVIKFGGEIQAAPSVQEPLGGNQVSISFDTDSQAKEAIAAITAQ